MNADVDPILVAGDGGVILEESTESEDDHATLDEFGIVATDGGEPVDDVQDENDDTIRVADDDGEVLCELDVPPSAKVSHSEDGSVTTIERPIESGGDLGIHVDPDSELGERFDVDETRGTFDGDVARYVCPNCGESTEGPLPEGR